MKSKKSVTDEVRKTIQEIKIEANKNIYKKNPNRNKAGSENSKHLIKILVGSLTNEMDQEDKM